MVINSFLREIADLDNELLKVRTLCNISSDESKVLLEEVYEIAKSKGFSTIGLLGSISTGLSYGYSIEYVMDKIRNNKPIIHPMTHFKNSFTELYKSLKWHQKLLLWFYDK